MAKVKYSPDFVPTSLSNLTKEIMFEYIKDKGTDEDKAWFKKLIHDHWTDQKKTPNGSVGQGIDDIQKVRKAFAERFFDSLLEKKPSKGKSYLDLVDSL